MIRRIIAALGATVVSACSQEPDFTQYREAVKNELRDPASAEFRNEQIRTLWTSGGRRITLYCAEVNANNAYGGKAGFKPVRIHISSRGLPTHLEPPLGDVWLESDMTPGHYLDCVRPDTQRNDDNFGKAFVSLGEFNQAEVDAAEPVLSDDVAPD